MSGQYVEYVVDDIRGWYALEYLQGLDTIGMKAELMESVCEYPKGMRGVICQVAYFGEPEGARYRLDFGFWTGSVWVYQEWLRWIPDDELEGWGLIKQKLGKVFKGGIT